MLKFSKSSRIALLLAPLLFALLYILFFGVNVIYWDEWSLVHFFEKVNLHTLSFSDLFAQHNEHRLFFPKLIYLTIIKVAHYDSRYGMLAVLIQLSIIGYLYYLKAKSQFGFTANTAPTWFIILLFFVFTLYQSENLLWGFQLAFLMPLTFSTLAFYLLDYTFSKETLSGQARFTFFALALACAIVASFSSSMGLLVWLVGALVLLIITPNFRTQFIYFASWCACGAISWVLYFSHYIKPGNHPSLLSLFQSPVSFIKYFTLLSGNIFLPFYANRYFPTITEYAGEIIGLIILCTGIYLIYSLIKSKAFRAYLFWISIGVYALLVMIVISVGRSGMGVYQAYSSRYVTYVIPLLVMVIVVFYNTIRTKQVVKRLLTALCVLSIVVSLGVGYVRGWYSMRERKQVKEVLRNFRNEPDSRLQLLCPSAEEVRNGAPKLQEYQYSVFKENIKK